MTMLTTKERLALAAEEARAAMRPAAGNARVKLGEATDQALLTLTTTVLPALVEARDKLAPVAEQAMSQGKLRGRDAALRWGMLEEPPEPEAPSHKLRNLFIVLGLGGAAAAAYKLLTGKDADPAWTSGRDSAAASATPAPAPDTSGDSVPWGDTPPDNAGMDPSQVDPAAAEPAGSDPLAAEMPSSTAGPTDGSDTAPTAPLASEETVESSVPTTPDQPLQRNDLT
ncbi:MAG: hypothetical protein H0V07_10645 [Propionibacteriales bacterium]|nr:hypothetical protein [Propionibacteriales bacterium]